MISPPSVDTCNQLPTLVGWHEHYRHLSTVRAWTFLSSYYGTATTHHFMFINRSEATINNIPQTNRHFFSVFIPVLPNRKLPHFFNPD
jgi:hypothetical protein